mgnify:CR=1 FL=1
MRQIRSRLPVVYYVCGLNGSDEDGAQIFDRKLLSALMGRRFEIETLRPLHRRTLCLPLWRGNILALSEILRRLRMVQREGARIVLSHERLFDIAHHMSVDLLIVHNYMPCFRFQGCRVLEIYYRLGSHRFVARAFENARSVIFLSHRDYRHAVEDFPQLADKSCVLPPPPHRSDLGLGRIDKIHVSGSDRWLPKRLSRLRPSEIRQIKTAGFKIDDFGPRPEPAFGLISDRFTVGFKLKLMQMLYVGDAIASLSDIRDDVMALAPDYPWWRVVPSVEEAVGWFQGLQRDSLWLEHCRNPASLKLPNWDTMAAEIASILRIGNSVR